MFFPFLREIRSIWKNKSSRRRWFFFRFILRILQREIFCIYLNCQSQLYFNPCVFNNSRFYIDWNFLHIRESIYIFIKAKNGHFICSSIAFVFLVKPYLLDQISVVNIPKLTEFRRPIFLIHWKGRENNGYEKIFKITHFLVPIPL